MGERKVDNIDLALVEDALAKLTAMTSLVKRLEECEKCGLKDDLSILLEDTINQFLMAGLEPRDCPGAWVRFVLRQMEAKR